MAYPSPHTTWHRGGNAPRILCHAEGVCPGLLCLLSYSPTCKTACRGSVEDLLALVRRETAPEAAQPSSNTAAAGAGTGAKAKGGAGAQAPGAAAQAQARRVYVILNNIDGPGRQALLHGCPHGGGPAQAHHRPTHHPSFFATTTGLRTEEGQALLSQLAACPGVHLVASIDHVNAPLMWSRAVEARFQ